MPIAQNPRAVVTGAAGGLGRAFALELAARRAKILIADVNERGAEETKQLVEQAGGTGHVVRCDVSKSDEVAALLGEADRALGGVDVLINNAGVGCGGAIGDVPLSDWEWVVGINLWGVIYGCHHFVPRFKQQRSGTVINVASAAGLVAMPMLGPYNVTKVGVVALSETLHAEVREHGIGVTVLCPTFFKTRIAEDGRMTPGLGSSVNPTMIDKLMRRAKLQADSVARVALEAADAGLLYAVPHPDGRWAWRLKRTVPELFHGLMPRMRRMFP